MRFYSLLTAIKEIRITATQDISEQFRTSQDICLGRFFWYVLFDNCGKMIKGIKNQKKKAITYNNAKQMAILVVYHNIR